MSNRGLIEEPATESIIGAFFEVYNQLGFGFVESIYVNSLEQELRSRGHRVDREVSVQVYYKGIKVGAHRIDMIVDDRVVVEGKSTEVLATHAGRQIQNYLKAARIPIGLLLHFGPKPKFYRKIAKMPGWVAGGPLEEVGVESHDVVGPGPE